MPSAAVLPDVYKRQIDLRLNGDAGEPTATAALECVGEYSCGSSARTESVWNLSLIHI